VARREKLTNIKDIADALNRAYLLLTDEETSGLSLVESAMAELEGVSDFDSDYKDLSEKTTESYYQLEEVASRLESFLSDLEFNPTELTELEERIFTLTTLKRKYGPELTDVLKTLDAAKLELSALTDEDSDIESLEAALKEKQKALLAAAEQLTAARQELAKDLERDIKQELADLYMEKADFRVGFEPAKFSANGNQHVEFYIQTNPGEGFKPLAKTASGGELSRLMLAIKSSFARRENKTSIVFDEVDTGVSGRVAQAIAEKIYKIARAGQVLAISHLPQVVAIADTQFYIEKSSTEEVTTSTVRVLATEERVQEIAKMLAGEKVTQEALAQAKKLLRH
jgi:DNA repair protein RecN (Recombination protein N)